MSYNPIMKMSSLNQYLFYQLYHARVLLHSLKQHDGEEELHEFRVALRRTRSLVKLFVDDSMPFSQALKTTMKATNSLRELDVLLMSISPSRFPILFKQLSKLRQEIFQTLFTPEFIYKTLLLLDESSELLFQNDSHFSSEILMQKALTHYQDCVGTYATLENNTKAKKLHHLRVEFKDARYSFEFLEISCIHESQEIIQHCKEFQNLLGAVQDAVNQVKLLKKIYHESPSSEVKKLLEKRKIGLKKLQKRH